MNDCNKCIVKGVKCAEMNASCKAIREISEQAIRDFAEWVDDNYETEHYIPNLVEFYERSISNGKIKTRNNANARDSKIAKEV